MKARIVERTRQNGAKKFLIQTRFLFWWFDGEWEYDSLAEAKKKLCFYDGTKIVDRVVEDDPHREPDPVVGALVAKLKTIFEERLKREEDPEGFLRNMSPYVVHEFKSWLPSVVSEAPFKTYVFNSSIHGGKAIVVEGDLAKRILVLGDLP